MSPKTARLQLPLLSAAQAQKELTINEALTSIDGIVAATVVSMAPASVPATPIIGQCWVVGPVPTSSWTGHASGIAAWTEGGWRFTAPVEGMSVWSVADNMHARFAGSAWLLGAMTGATFSVAGQRVVGARQPHINAPSGGTVIDVQARNALATLLAQLENHGLLAAT